MAGRRPTYGWRVPAEKTNWIAFAAYTLLRVGLFVIAWGLLVWLTPLTGVFAAVLAILISSIVSIPLLSHQRDAFSVGVAGFFKRMNERIDASARAEDEPDESSHQGDGGTDQQAVAKDE